MIVFVAGVLVAVTLGLRGVQVPITTQAYNRPPLPPGLDTFEPGDLPGLHRLNDQQLQVFLNLLGSVPQIPIEAQPRYGGNYYSLKNPAWPPLPGNTAGEPIWQMNGFCLINDLNYDYDNPPPHKVGPPGKKSKLASGFQMTANVAVPGPGGDGSTNSYSPQFQSSYTLPPGLKLTPPIFTNGNVSVSIYEQDPSVPYDIYYCTNLLPPIQWNLASHGVVGQTNYVFANSFGGSPTVFFMVGSGADTVGQGLSDGFISLVLHLNPFASSADGMTIGWKYLHGLNPAITYTNYTPTATPLTIIKPSNRAIIQ